MAALKSAAGMDYWRDYFKNRNADIFDTIEKAIMIAASDYPDEFRIRRDGIAQMLYSCRMIKCSRCDKVELGLPANHDDHKEMDMVDNHHINNHNYGAAEALTDEMEEESQMFVEVLRIKDILENKQDQSESVLYNSLRKLQLMDISVETLKATDIGRAVNLLKKHNANDVSKLADTLIKAWKDMVDEWVMATENITVDSRATPDSLNPSGLDEEDEGLPSPPLDDFTFIYPHTSLEPSEFFHGVEENRNGFNKNRNNVRTEKESVPNCKQQKSSNVQTMVRKSELQSDVKKQEGLMTKKHQPTKPSIPESTSGRQMTTEQKLQIIPKKPQQSNPRGSGEASAGDKFKAAKRKLHERYQEAENAKKQRTIQVMEVHDLPEMPNRGFPGRSQANGRPGSNHNRHRR